MFNELKKINDNFSVAGYEANLTAFIANEVKKYCDECYVDNIGNLICHKSGKGKKVLVNIPVSAEGIFITHIADDGALKFVTVGKIKAVNLIGAKVKNQCGQTVGVILSGDKKEEETEIEDLYVDMGVSDKSEAEKIVSIGEVLEPFLEIYPLGDNFYGSKLSKAVPVFAGISLIKELNTVDDIFFAFTVMDNLGFKGAKTAANMINPDICYTLSVADTSNKNTKIELGKGAVIRIKDSHIIVSKSLRDTLIKNISKEEIPYQLEIVASDGLSNNEIMYLGRGILTANINCPVKCVNSLCEGVNKKDVECVIKSLKTILV